MRTLIVLLVLAFIVLGAVSLKAATISGKVTNAEGIPIQGVEILQSEGCVKLRRVNRGGVFTDINGEYVIQMPDTPCYVTWIRPHHDDYDLAFPNAAVFLFFPQGEQDFILDN